MATTSAILKMTKGGKEIQKALTYVNPAASNEAIKALGQAVAGLSKNTYASTDRVDKSNCDTEQGGGGGSSKPAPTLYPATADSTSGKTGYLGWYACDFVAYVAPAGNTYEILVQKDVSGGTTVLIKDTDNNVPVSVYVPEDEYHCAKTFDVTITAAS